jgi:hypothetical protein
MGCSSHIIIDPYGYPSSSKFREVEPKIGLTEKDLESSEFILKHQSWTWFGHLIKPEVVIGSKVRHKVGKITPMEDIVIKTEYGFWDVVFGWIPVLSPRTVSFYSNYKK